MIRPEKWKKKNIDVIFISIKYVKKTINKNKCKEKKYRPTCLKVQD